MDHSTLSSELDTILKQYVNPEKGILHGAAFVVVDNHGMCAISDTLANSPLTSPFRADIVLECAGEALPRPSQAGSDENLLVVLGGIHVQAHHFSRHDAGRRKGPHRLGR